MDSTNPNEVSRAGPRPAKLPLSNLVSLSLLNLGRHGLRTAINVTGIAVAVAALIFFLSFYRGTYEGVMFNSVIEYSTSHGQFMSTAFDDDDPETWLEAGNLFDDDLADAEKLLPPVTNRDGDRYAVTAPRLVCPAFAGNGSRTAQITLAGVDFLREEAVLSVDERMIEGTFGPGGVVIGKKLAQMLSLTVGDEIRIQAETADDSPNLDYWAITGIFSTGYPPEDRGLVMTALSEVQTFLSAERKINKIYSRLAPAGSSTARERAIARLEADAERTEPAGLGLQFRSWKKYAKAMVEDAKMDGIFFAVFLGILLFLSLSTIAGTMRVAIYERKREIGMLRASGWFRNEITMLFLFEALLIGIAGSIAGCVIGGIPAILLQVNPVPLTGALENLDIPSFSFACDLQVSDFIVSMLTGFFTALLAGIFPARNGARMPILTALAER